MHDFICIVYMKKRFFLIFCISFFILNNKSFTQSDFLFDGFEDDLRGENSLRIVFYNLENFFDTRNDSITSDDEFSSFGLKHWGREKYERKLANTYKTIAAVGGWEPPDIIGLCEVENRFVLSDIIFGTPLRKFKYKYIHYDSPDPRGIDVALIYRTDKFKPLFSYPIQIKYPFDTNSRTRDILYVSGLLPNKDTLHLFVNHFPSKYGGANITIPKRNFVAGVLKTYVDSLFLKNADSKVLIMGDFNDEPYDESMQKYLNARCDSTNLKPADLLNLMCNMKNIEKIGSNKFRDTWSMIDQIIVSKSLINNNSAWNVKNSRAYIFKAPFLLQTDDTFMGVKTFRTYNGFKYTGGFSDHLPVYIDLIKNKLQ